MDLETGMTDAKVEDMVEDINATASGSESESESEDEEPIYLFSVLSLGRVGSWRKEGLIVESVRQGE